MNYRKLILVTGGLFLLISGSVFAAELSTFASVARKLTVGTNLLTKFFHLVCIIVGISLLVMAFSLYKAHQANPKFVPLDRPIVYILLGLTLMSVPFFGDFIGGTGSAADVKKREAHVMELRGLDSPAEEWGNDYGY